MHYATSTCLGVHGLVCKTLKAVEDSLEKAFSVFRLSGLCLCQEKAVDMLICQLMACAVCRTRLEI